ncbi:DUF1572 family protein [Flectobacillus major]|uniref:DUF1572 family protein n=1 Tax=Flectobacillus major TaxID=103 RepID=UPI00041999DF|nr:DUF1572 family protein [Flectobacillus major]
MTLALTLFQLFERDLTRLKAELNLYSLEENIWKMDKNIANSAGNLTLHLIGNLNTYIGAELGQSGYIRNRPLEFSDKNVPRQILIQKIDDTLSMLKKALSTLNSTDFEQQYPILVFEEKTSTEYLLVHLCTHLSYHLGQINYHRRLLDA